MRTALIMEGGAMRGMFTCGIIDAFLENGIEFDGSAGISAGAAFGCNYKSKQVGRALRYNKRFINEYKYGSLKSYLKTGDIFDVDFCFREIPYELDVFDAEAFEKNPMEFWVGATDLETGKCRYFNCKNGSAQDLSWMRASSSIPFLSNIVEVDGYKLLDGGIADSIPYDFMMKERGYEKSITILTREDGYVKKKNKMLPLIKMKYRKYPEFVKAVASRHERYNDLYKRIKEDEKAGKTLVLRPSEPLNIKQIEKNPDELQRVYDIGHKLAIDNLDRIREFIGAK